jgi:hypothetical protein
MIPLPENKVNGKETRMYTKRYTAYPAESPEIMILDGDTPSLEVRYR